MSLLRVENLSVSRQKRIVLDDLSFTVRAGEFIGLIGPNGAGKSTLLRAVLGQLPYQGYVEVNGHNATQLSSHERAQCLSYIAQSREIGWNVTVETLVQLGRVASMPRFASLLEHDKLLVHNAMSALQVQHLADKPARQLSGGEQARALIARAVAQNAPLMLADEPVAGLDPAHQLGLMQTLRDLAAAGCSIICTLHELSLAARWCSRLILLKEGKLIADGSPSEILTAAVIRDLYGIEVYRAETMGGLIIQPTEIIK